MSPAAGTAIAPRPAAAPAPAARNAPPVAVTPFTRAAREHSELMDDRSTQMTAATIAVGPIDVPAYGYLRDIAILVNATGGVGATTTATFEDAPWNVFQEITLFDVNGAPIVGPFSGYDLYLVNKYNGYKGNIDPKGYPMFSAPVVGANASGNFAFFLRLPVEINSRDALGAIGNENASSVYKLRYVLNASTAIYTTPPSTTLPLVRVRLELEAWSQPPAVDLLGNPQATAPPAHGTIGYLSKQLINFNTGQQNIRSARVGNYIRDMILICRDASTPPTRSAGNALWPDPMSLYWDTRLLEGDYADLRRQKMAERGDYTAAIETADGLDRGVFVYDFMHEFDQQYGQELRDGWLATVQSTRLEFQGNFTGNGALTIITHDVAPVGPIFV